ncbi:hypothetical protein MASR1M90_12750 [Desulfovibrionales bacterium]
MMVSISVPLLEKGQGVAGFDLSLENLQRLAAQVVVFETGYGFLVSNTGMVVAHQDSNFIGKISSNSYPTPTKML